MLKFVLIFLFLAVPASAQVRIIDGDTLDIGETRYRINGIDAPELGQRCQTASGKNWGCGVQAREMLKRFTQSGKVRCRRLATDDYEREIARCQAGSLDLAEAMVRAGMAWAYVKFSNEYTPMQTAAQRAKRGIWQGPAKQAWVFRAERWEVAKQVSPNGCPIKGNISQNGRIYHTPWSRYYSRTRITVAKGERWFCDEAEALRAGWRAPYND